MLTLGWSDGNTFLPISFNLLSSAKDENVLCEAKTVDKRTLAVESSLMCQPIQPIIQVYLSEMTPNEAFF